MVKKFKIIQNLEKKYNGENLPIRVRQDDVGTIIESQILTEDNNPYDLSKCSVTFNLQPATGIPVLGEKVTITDAIDGKISYSLSAKDTKHAGRVKSAFFTINNADNSIVESTGDIDLTIMPFPKITDADYLTKVSDFKGRVRGDFNSNPNFISFGNYSSADLNNNWTVTFNNILQKEAPQEIYENLKFDKLYYYLYSARRVGIYAIKILENATKIVIRNFNFEGNRGICILDNRFSVQNGDNIAINTYNNHIRLIKDNLNLLPKLKPVKVSKDGYFVDFEIDLINSNYLSKDNYLILTNVEGMNQGVAYLRPCYDEESGRFYEKLGNEQLGKKDAIEIPTKLTCTQYYLPD
ncbi:hypothetical protein DS832_04860 [Bombilactobacillus bombi]|uniref:BppU N-terminal domain-containing protein n=1 Tax=Bombilactobacillus bombi TaxID=1303590 RepID=A0A417Z859_9LACO|nr:BppU family phage baseplate upper protein [Bombilactobacillus bombi]RHW46822.1 hypothetical protein DS832_04860 [Bombilactobacillus bombi]